MTMIYIYIYSVPILGWNKRNNLLNDPKTLPIGRPRFRWQFRQPPNDGVRNGGGGAINNVHADKIERISIITKAALTELHMYVRWRGELHNDRGVRKCTHFECCWLANLKCVPHSLVKREIIIMNGMCLLINELIQGRGNLPKPITA